MFPPKMTIAKAAEALARSPAPQQPGEKFTYGCSTEFRIVPAECLIQIFARQQIPLHARPDEEAVYGCLRGLESGHNSG